MIFLTMLVYYFSFTFTGAGNFPRHTEMLSKLSPRNENMAKFGAENPLDKNNMLWRADWGLKQWIPYLLGTKKCSDFYYIYFVFASLVLSSIDFDQISIHCLDILMDGDSVTTEMVMHYLLGKILS